MNDERLIFHLSIPVHDLDEALAFYQTAVGAVVGRRSVDWLDVLMWGHQVTLQLRPDEVLGPNEQGKRHFGVEHSKRIFSGVVYWLCLSSWSKQIYPGDGFSYIRNLCR